MDLLDRGKLTGRLARLSRFSVTMGLIQLMNMVCGFLIVNLLSVNDYALYTLVLMLTMSVKLLGSSGLVQILLFDGGPNWREPTQLGQSLRLVLRILKRLFPVVFVVAFPFVYYLLRETGFLLPVVLPYYLILGGLALTMALSSLFLEVARLHGQLPLIMRTNFWAALSRLVVVGPLLYFVTEPWLALLAVVPGIFIELRNYGRFCRRKAPWRTGEAVDNSSEARAAMAWGRARKFILRSWPNDLFYIFSGLAKLTLLAVFGGAQTVASFGALERFGVITTLVSLVVGNIFLPYYAKRDRQGHLLATYFLLIAVATAVPLGFLAMTFVVPGQLLALLGRNYLGLEQALVLMAIGLCLLVIESVSGKLMQVRGHILSPIWVVAGNLGSFTLFLLLFDVTTLSGVLWLAIAQSATLGAINLLYAYRALRTESRAQPR